MGEDLIKKTKEEEILKNGGEPLYQDMVAFVIRSGKASEYLLQQEYGIDSERARQAIELLEERSIIGPYNDLEPREVLIPLENVLSDHAKQWGAGRKEKTEEEKAKEDEMLKNGEEPLYHDMVTEAIRSGAVSFGSFQYDYGIDSERAHRAIELLEERGIVGPHKSSIEPSESLIPLEKILSKLSEQSLEQEESKKTR